jgi:glycosyltransferase involved in cell wall biosynthesis
LRVLWVMKKQLDVALDRTVRIEMIRALQRLGHEVTLAVGYRNARPDYGQGESIVYLPSSKLPVWHHMKFSAGVRQQLPRMVENLKPDAVIVDVWTAEIAARWRRGLGGGPRPIVIADVRTLPVNQHGIRGWGVARAFRRGVQAMNALDGVTLITDSMREMLVQGYGLSTSLPSDVWTSGVNLTRFDASVVAEADRARVRAQVGGKEPFVVMYHGAITRERGVGTLIQAVANSRPASGAPVRLLLVGDGRDRASLLAQARRDGTAQSVHYVRPVPNEDMPTLISACDVGALPLPDLEGWRVSSPIKLFEYWAMGKPAVVTDIAAHRFAAAGSAGAIVAPSADADGLRRAIERAADFAPGELARRGAAGRARAEEAFSWDAQASHLGAFLAKLRNGDS